MIGKLRHLLVAGALMLALSACAVGVRTNTGSATGSAIGGGPAQATSQALVVMQSTTTAFATASAGSLANAVPCECDTGK